MVLKSQVLARLHDARGKLAGSRKAAGPRTDTGAAFAGTNGLAFGPDGKLYSPRRADNSVVRIDLTTGERLLFATIDGGADDLVFDDHGTLFVSSALDGGLLSISPHGHVRTLSRPGLTSPGGVALLPSGPGGQNELWVADFFTLRSFNASTGRPRRVERTTPGLTALAPPATVSADGHLLLLTSWILGAVQSFDPLTSTVLASYGGFAVPLQALRFEGDVIVAQLVGGAVVRANGANPTERRVLTSLGVAAGLAARDGDLWAADWAHGTVVQLVAGGLELSPPLVVASGLDQPEGLVALANGELAVVEAGGGRVSRINPATGSRTTVATGLGLGAPAPPNVPPTWFFSGLAVAQDGTLYAAGDRARTVYRLRP